ncbi:MAG: trigger factor [Verrucomicrobia bacterium]|nr:trigger factor [Verrucomicrobiota bacterium]
MNATLQDLGPCKKQLRIEVAADRVNAAIDAATKYFVRNASLPGFRPGKAPREMILKRFEPDITTEAKRKLWTDAYQEAVKQHKLEPITDPEVEEVQFAQGQEATAIFTLETVPVFELPEYRSLPATRASEKVDDTHVEKALESLRQQKADYLTANRPAQNSDVVVINYQGHCDGKPIQEIAPVARGLNAASNFWVRIAENSFIPGFTEQLVGASAGDKRTVTVDFAADFVTPQLQGRKGSFDVEIVEVKEQKLPELDDAFAKLWKAETLHQLREGVRSDLQNEANGREQRNVRAQVVKALMDRVDFAMPEAAVAAETRNVVYNIVAENKQRGVAQELIDQQKDDIMKAAAQTAKERVKASFLFSKIAVKEGIKVSNEELSNRIMLLAQRYKTPPDKFVKELQEKNAVQEIVGQLLHEKVVDFLQQHAKIEDAPAS